MKKPTKTRLRNKADKILQDLVKKRHKGELCWLCGNKPIVVGHHFIYKSQSNATRYYLPNITPLCRDCHCLIHAQPSITNAKIALKMGQEWLNDLEYVKRIGVKANKEWYNINLKVLEEMCAQESRGVDVAGLDALR